jgi:hypothetical protein
MSADEYTPPRLLDFLREAPKQGLLNPAVARSRANAIEQLFTELTRDEKCDIRLIDVDKLSARVHKIQDSTSRPEAVALYASRVQEALIDYLAWLQNPTTFATISGHALRRGVRPAGSDAENAEEVRALEDIALATSERRKDYLSVPLREGVNVFITNLPLDLSADEARRVSQVVLALARPAASGAGHAD